LFWWGKSIISHTDAIRLVNAKWQESQVFF
jgi:hypothetical protein